MATKTKWFFFWLISGSFLAGILAVCFVVSAVNWLGSETFCSTGCHTMNGVAMHGNKALMPEHQAARPRTALTATCTMPPRTLSGP